MNYSLGFLKNFLRDEEGAELVEWIVFVALLVLGIAGAVASCGARYKADINVLATA